MTIGPQEYTTTDFEKSLILYSAGRYLLRTEWDKDNTQATFIFGQKKDCERTLHKHQIHSLRIESNRFLHAYRELKTLLFLNKK